MCGREPGEHGDHFENDQPVTEQTDAHHGVDVRNVRHRRSELFGDFVGVPVRPDALAENPFEAQFFVELGWGNSRGLTIIQTSESTIGIRQYHPMQSRLQMARAIKERALNRVQTLRGWHGASSSRH